MHLLLSCLDSREFWFPVLRRLGLHGVIPPVDVVDLVDWWLPNHKHLC
jgi:hypothetical protein